MIDGKTTGVALFFALTLGLIPWVSGEESAEERLIERLEEAVDPDDDVLNRLHRVLDQTEQEIAAWKASADGQRLMELEKEMKAAARARDVRGVRSASGKAKPLRAEYRSLVEASKNRILDVLSPEQKQDYLAWLMGDYFLELAATLELTEEQKKRVHLLAREVAEAELARPGQYLELEERVEAQVLTPAQIEAFAQIKMDNKMRSLRVPEM